MQIFLLSNYVSGDINCLLYTYTEDWLMHSEMFTFSCKATHASLSSFISLLLLSVRLMSSSASWISCVSLILSSYLHDHSSWVKLHAPVIWSLVNFRSLFYENNYSDLVLLLIILDLGPDFDPLGSYRIYLAMLRRAKYVTWGILLVVKSVSLSPRYVIIKGQIHIQCCRCEGLHV